MTVRIVHAGNFLRRRYGHAKTSNEHKLFFGFIRNDYKAYEFSDRDTARFESILKSRHFGARAANRRLLEMCDNVRPDLVLVAHADLVTNDTLKAIRQLVPGVRIAYRFEDPPYVAENRAKIDHRLGHVDIIFLGFAGARLREYATTSTEVAFLPHPTDPCVENLRNFERSDFDHDLLFCGIGNTSDDRHTLVGALLHELEEVRFRVCGMHGYPTVLGLDYENAMAESKMALSLNRTEIGDLCSSDRISHLFGNGLLVFLPEAVGYSRFLSSDDTVYFSDKNDLITKIHELNADDDRRCAVAQSGWRTYNGLFCSTRVSRYLVETTLGIEYSETYEWQNERYRAAAR